MTYEDVLSSDKEFLRTKPGSSNSPNELVDDDRTRPAP
eukprot:CAMPEP_0117429628 /NCGR_PEP_ID=MMETSP0758-20121206/9161_1 /TAXON_ID=63605 /ORGANISM="Percolomonas cosmopolitus, Strain AE-1 (ATCC 50343)" /LENGTH=37 /DNA_ID= /DNA_START= /DNA_END= /DNA_ORIENTATION=